MAEIDILLACYNGEKYIESQILSLIAQNFTDWQLLIHDDGSQDNTVTIVKRYSKIDTRIILIEDGCKNLGPAYNFLHLLKFSTSEFIIFCDQDDIWLENKLEQLLFEIKRKDNNIPQAVYSNSYVYQCDVNEIFGNATLTYPKTLNELLFLNSGIQGCAVLFNNKLRNICLEVPSYVCMHDHLLALVAVTFGEYSYLDKRLMLYRRHVNTVTGGTSSNLFSKFKSFLDPSKAVIDIHHYNSVVSFYNNFFTRISDEKKKIFEAYLLFPKGNLVKRIALIIRIRFTIFNSLTILLLKVILRKPINNV